MPARSQHIHCGVPDGKPETPNHPNGAAQQNGQCEIIERIAIDARCSDSGQVLVMAGYEIAGILD